jgi:hypothetical protein
MSGGTSTDFMFHGNRAQNLAANVVQIGETRCIFAETAMGRPEGSTVAVAGPKHLHLHERRDRPDLRGFQMTRQATGQLPTDPEAGLVGRAQDLAAPRDRPGTATAWPRSALPAVCRSGFVSPSS